MAAMRKTFALIALTACLVCIPQPAHGSGSIFFSGPSTSPPRKLSTSVNPQCPGNYSEECSKADVNLVYTRSDSPDNSVHYLWSTIGGAPGFLAVQTPTYDKLVVNWTELLSNSSSDAITFQNPQAAIGVSISKVFFWNDTGNTGYFDESSNETDVKSWSDLELQDVRKSLQNNDNSAGAQFVYRDPVSNMTLTFGVFVSGSNGRNTELPRLLYTEKSIHVELLIEGAANDSIKNQRPGLELTIFHESAAFKLERKKSIDDEYSPGVFSRLAAQFGTASNISNSRSYIYWKPVGYSKSDRIIAHTIDAIPLGNPNTTNLPYVPEENTPLYAFFTGYEREVTKLNVTFGSSQESFYRESNFTSFNFVVGLGEVPEDQLSFLVEIIIFAGFGLPVIAIVLSGFYLLIKRCRRRSYDEALLGSESVE